MKRRFANFLSLLYFLLFFAPFSYAQFPTAIGTKWEFFQLYEDNWQQSAVMPCFQDEVVGDTLADGNTYQIVRRTGHMYNGFGPSINYDTVDGTWYYRVMGTQVWVLDSVISGKAQESLLYEFGLSLGDTLTGRVKNRINLTESANQAYLLQMYDYDATNQQFPWLDSVFVLSTTASMSTYLPIRSTWDSHRNIDFLPNVGTIYSTPYQSVLDIHGQYYVLKQLSSNGQILYQNPFIATSMDSPIAHVASIYPNPAIDRLRISSPDPLSSIRMVDATGKTVAEFAPSSSPHTQDVEVKELPRGLYWIILDTGGIKETHAVLLR